MSSGRFFRGRDAEAGTLFVLLVPGMFAISLHLVIDSYFAGSGFPPITYAAAGAALLFKIALNLLVVPRLGLAGAAITTSLVYACLLTVKVIVFRRATGVSLAGLLRPQRGEVRAFGEDPSRLSPRALVRRIGTVFQDPEHQLVAWRVDEELRVGPRAVGLPNAEIERRVRELLERLDLAKLAAANPFTLSGGEKRRLSVGTALATSPGALVLDEPTFGQDRRTFAELLALLAEFRDGGGAIAFASHDELFVDAFADERLRLERGRAA